LGSKNIKDNIIKIETTSVCASSFGLHDFDCLSSLLKAYIIFEKSLQKFEMDLNSKWF
jgi:hypothetical protein